MEQLEQKLARELPNTAKVVACRFPFPNWVPERTAGEGLDTVWLYDATTARGDGTVGGGTGRTDGTARGGGGTGRTDGMTRVDGPKPKDTRVSQ